MTPFCNAQTTLFATSNKHEPNNCLPVASMFQNESNSNNVLDSETIPAKCNISDINVNNSVTDINVIPKPEGPENTPECSNCNILQTTCVQVPKKRGPGRPRLLHGGKDELSEKSSAVKPQGCVSVSVGKTAKKMLLKGKNILKRKPGRPRKDGIQKKPTTTRIVHRKEAHSQSSASENVSESVNTSEIIENNKILTLNDSHSNMEAAEQAVHEVSDIVTNQICDQSNLNPQVVVENIAPLFPKEKDHKKIQQDTTEMISESTNTTTNSEKAPAKTSKLKTTKEKVTTKSVKQKIKKSKGYV